MKGFGRQDSKMVRDESDESDESDEKLNPLDNPDQGSSWFSKVLYGTANFVSEHLLGNKRERDEDEDVDQHYPKHQVSKLSAISARVVVSPKETVSNKEKINEFPIQVNDHESVALNQPGLLAFANNVMQPAVAKETPQQIATEQDIAIFECEKKYDQTQNYASAVRCICFAINHRISSLARAGKLENENGILASDMNMIPKRHANEVHSIVRPLWDLIKFAKDNQIGKKTSSGEVIMTHSMLIDLLVKVHGEAVLDNIAIEMNKSKSVEEKGEIFAKYVRNEFFSFFLDPKKLQPSSKDKPRY